jgi:rifampicin phosphotransferase
LKQALLSSDEEAFWLSLRDFPNTQTKIDDYIETYGDRVIGELKLETETLRQNKSFLIRILKSYVGDPNLSLHAFEDRQADLRQAAEQVVFSESEELKGRHAGRWAVRRLQKNLRNFRKAIRYREAMRLERTRSFGIFRSIYLDLGERLRAQGLLKETRDVFYLKTEELDEVFHAKALFDDPRSIVETRKSQYQTWSELNPEPHLALSVPLRGLPTKPTAAISGDLKGLGCYPGTVEAEVVVVHDPTKAADLKGKILVAERTDPGWTPLFLQIRGLIVERGSQLSHSAVVARELGLPTIVAVPGICQLLKSGQRVFMDGQTGSIQVVSAPSQITAAPVHENYQSEVQR